MGNPHAALGHRDAARGNVWNDRRGCRRIDGEGFKVAIIHSDHGSTNRQGPGELLFVANLHKGGQTAFVRGLNESGQLVW